MMTQRSLQQWLSHLETAHSNGLIDMGLDRVRQVKEAMQLTPHCPIITVAGTNGKGSTCAFLSHIYREAGFKTGTLTSPHLLKFNERIAINCQAVDDDTITASFERIEAARGKTSLTYFEFNTLAAVDIFIQAKVDVMILEVGLGGRLDAVNIFDPDCAIVTSVDLDHQNYLGNTIEEVGFEKAGIFRPHTPAICGQNPPPQSLVQHAQNIQADLLLFKHDFDFSKLENQQWSFAFTPHATPWLNHHRKRNALPIPALRGQYQLNNASCALAAIECLNAQLPVDIGSIKRGLLLAENIGRFQVLPGRPLTILDVAHNPHAARALRQGLLSLPFAQNRIAIFSILADKDIDGVIALLKDQFDEWYIAPLDMPRGMTTEAISQQLIKHNITQIRCFENVAQACRTALSVAAENDRIVTFGSFHTVAEAFPIFRP